MRLPQARARFEGIDRKLALYLAHDRGEFGRFS
jgi:hypothetical protein